MNWQTQLRENLKMNCFSLSILSQKGFSIRKRSKAPPVLVAFSKVYKYSKKTSGTSLNS
jgi:hypothetical protein